MTDNDKPKTPPQPDILIQKFAALVAGYSDIAYRYDEGIEQQHDLAELQAFLSGFHRVRSAWEKTQATLADDFNLLQVMGIAEDEITHSRILAWLLDRRLEHGTHAQGNLGLRLLVQELKPELKSESTPSYPYKPYWVRCEVSGSESRVDIEIAAKGEFIIHIENKIGSLEGDDQTNREWRDLKRRAKELGISGSNIHGIFLTLDGSNPDSDNFKAVGWHRLASVIERFAEEAQPIEVKLFASHYARAIRKLILSEPEAEDKRKWKFRRLAIPNCIS